MRKMAISWTGALVLALTVFAISCSSATDTTDGGGLDAEDGGDVDPCQAAQNKWNEIWQVKTVDLGL